MIRYVKRLKAVNLIDPHLRFREDGGYAANHYQFAVAVKQPTLTPPEAVATAAEADKGNGAEPPSLVAEMPPPGGAPATPPSGNFATTPGGTDATALKNKTEERTTDPLLCLPTEKQKTCQHPQEEIAHLSENIIICNHCFALLDENPTLATITLPRFSDRALPECEGLPEPKAMQPPVGNISTQRPVRSDGEKNSAVDFGTTASETPLRMAWKSPQIGPREEKTAKMTNPLVLIGKLITGALQGG